MSVRVVRAADLAGGGLCDTLIDARSPAEFAEDHLFGAVNWPVLDDEQRRHVGTLYKQVSALQARKVGAAIVARNLAAHLERELDDRPREWRPLVYCWRGGQRSGALAWYLGQIGFRTLQLDGGYKAWRALVREQLQSLPRGFRYRVLCGRTGSGKTRLLLALADQGAQVLDLEGLAAHRGSVLGAVPGREQPSQKHFDHRVWQALRGFDARRPVFVEGESRRIGRLRVPEVLASELREHGSCVRIELPEPARLDLLLQDYAHFAAEPEQFCRQLDALVELRGRDTVRGWQAQARAGDWRALFGALMRDHYDPLYLRSMNAGYQRLSEAAPLVLADASPTALQAAARRLLDDEDGSATATMAAASVPGAITGTDPRWPENSPT